MKVALYGIVGSWMPPVYRRRCQDGFTLIELLLVIGIIGLLAAIVLVAINPSRQLAQTRNAARRKDARELINAVHQHVLEKGAVPTGIDTTLRMIGTDASGCSVMCSQGGAPVTIVSFSTRIADVNDDVEERLVDGGMRPGSSDLELSVDTTPWNLTDFVGLRFPNVTVPAGSTIISAVITFRVNEVTTDPASLNIHAHAMDDAPAFNTNPYDLTSRPRTSAVVAWDPPGWTVENDYKDTPDIASIIQEVVSRPGWASGNDLSFIFDGTGTRTAFALEGNPNDSAPLLTLTYAAGSDVTAGSCLNLDTPLAGSFVAGLPQDPKLGSAAKTFYSVKKLASGRLYVQACGAELGEKIAVEQ
ncbi:MAG: metallophosphoesterase [Candidatus Peregrinibacteria bacterium Greene0416_19]|nr:MAG: metallophosphoesterase [Candidatus Peregrinibacteria bacterium Greene0416_19]